MRARVDRVKERWVEDPFGWDVLTESGHVVASVELNDEDDLEGAAVIARIIAGHEAIDKLAELVSLVELADNDPWRRISMDGTDIELEPYRALVKRARGLT